MKTKNKSRSNTTANDETVIKLPNTPARVQRLALVWATTASATHSLGNAKDNFALATGFQKQKLPFLSASSPNWPVPILRSSTSSALSSSSSPASEILPKMPWVRCIVTGCCDVLILLLLEPSVFSVENALLRWLAGESLPVEVGEDSGAWPRVCAATGLSRASDVRDEATWDPGPVMKTSDSASSVEAVWCRCLRCEPLGKGEEKKGVMVQMCNKRVMIQGRKTVRGRRGCRSSESAEMSSRSSVWTALESKNDNISNIMIHQHAEPTTYSAFVADPHIHQVSLAETKQLLACNRVKLRQQLCDVNKG